MGLEIKDNIWSFFRNKTRGRWRKSLEAALFLQGGGGKCRQTGLGRGVSGTAAKGICRDPVALVLTSVKAVPYSACCSSGHG